MTGDASGTWGQRHFGGLELGDARRSRRLPELVDAMCRQPGGTLPEKLTDPADLRSCYRMLGRASQILHHRPEVSKRETDRQKRERENRESRLGVRGAAASGPPPAAGRVVDVSDRLSDAFECMAAEIEAGRRFVLRSKDSRKLLEPIDGRRDLHDAVRTKLAVAAMVHDVPAATGRAARPAQRKVSFAPVTLALPGKRAGEYADRFAA